ncbi:hypothetical protein D3C75_274790 [compost metagenome]
MAIAQAQELVGANRPGHAEERVETTDQRQVVPAILQAIVEAQIRAGLRHPRSVPVEKVLCPQGQLRADRQTGGQLVTRDEQLLGFGAWHCQRLGKVQAGLAETVAVGKGQDAFTPVLGVLAELGAEQRLFADFRAAKDEGIEDFGRWAVVVAIDITAHVSGVRPTTIELIGRRIVAADIVVGMVIPTVGTDAKTGFLLVGHVQFGEHVQALGHCTAR